MSAAGDLSIPFFCASGSEAIEAAIKLARAYHDARRERRRYRVGSLHPADHSAKEE